VRPFLRVTLGLSARWFVHRWHADRELVAWRTRPARAGATIAIGCFRVNVALLGPERDGAA